MKKGVDPRGLIQVFLRRGSEVGSRLASLSPVLKPLGQGGDRLDRDPAESIVDLLKDLEEET